MNTVEEMSEVPDDEHSIKVRVGSPYEMSYLPNVPDVFQVEGNSTVKLAIYETIKNYDYRRPLHNLIRNRNKDGLVKEFITL